MNYFYEAEDGDGKSQVGKLDAATISDAHKILRERGLRVKSLVPNASPFGSGSLGDLTIAPDSQLAAPPVNQNSRATDPSMLVASGGTGSIALPSLSGSMAYPSSQRQFDSSLPGRYISSAPRPIVPSNEAGVSSADQLLFFQQLAPLVKSGMTIFAALDNLAARTKNKHLARIAHEMAMAAKNGDRITDIMSKYPRIFPTHIVGTVRAGEVGGFLEVVLAEVAHNYEQKIALYRGSKLWRAIVLQSYVGLALVIPFFSSVFNSMDFGANMQLYFRRELIVLPIFGLLYMLAMMLAKHSQEPHFRTTRDTIVLKMPVFGDLQRQSALSNFVRMLRKLYDAGVGPINAWEAAMFTAENTVIRNKLVGAYSHMQRGQSLGEAFAATGLFADNIEQLVITGELSGEVMQSLDHAADMYVNQVQEAHARAKRSLFRLAVLAALIIGGGAFLWMTKSYFASIFDFADKFADG